jgi:hypothetical protein
MSDLTNPRLMYLKAGLLVVAGIMAATAVWLETRSFKVLALLVLAVWCFCRAYYFAFYVIEHYIDGQYRYAGLWSFMRRHSPPRMSRASTQSSRPVVGRRF